MDLRKILLDIDGDSIIEEITVFSAIALMVGLFVNFNFILFIFMMFMFIMRINNSYFYRIYTERMFFVFRLGFSRQRVYINILVYSIVFVGIMTICSALMILLKENRMYLDVIFGMYMLFIVITNLIGICSVKFNKLGTIIVGITYLFLASQLVFRDLIHFKIDFDKSIISFFNVPMVYTFIVLGWIVIYFLLKRLDFH